MRISPVTILDHATIAGGTESAVQQLNQIFGYSAQCQFEVNGGSIAGSLVLQGSLGREDEFVDIIAQDIVTANDSILFNVPTSMYPFVKIVFRDSSSTSEPTLTIKFFARGF